MIAELPMRRGTGLREKHGWPLAEPIADILAVCTTAAMFAIQFKKSMAELENA